MALRLANGIISRTKCTSFAICPIYSSNTKAFYLQVNPRLLGISHVAAAVNFGNVMRFSTSNSVYDTSSTAAGNVESIPSVDPPFVEMGLADGWWPVDILQSILENAHYYTGLPWWATIIIGTFGVRTLTTPAFLAGKKAMISSMLHKDQTDKLTQNLQDAYQKGRIDHIFYCKNKLKEHNKVNGTSAASMGINGIQPVIFYWWYRAISQMCSVPVPSMATGGILWFPNLAIADSTLILPFICGTVMAISLFSTLKLQAIQINKYTQYGLFSLPVILPLLAYSPLLSHFSSAVFLYVTANSMATIAVVLYNAEKFENMKKSSDLFKSKQKGIGGIVARAHERAENSSRKRQYRMQMKENRDLERKRKKELKKAPPITYEIGTEAILREHTPDFEVDTRPPKPTITKYS